MKSVTIGNDRNNASVSQIAVKKEVLTVEEILSLNDNIAELTPKRKQLKNGLTNVSDTHVHPSNDRLSHEIQQVAHEEDRIYTSFSQVIKKEERSEMDEMFNLTDEIARLTPMKILPNISDALQLNPSSHSIWRGHIWSKLHFEIKVNSNYLWNDSTCILAPSIESPMFKDLIDHTNSRLIKFEFMFNGLCLGSKVKLGKSHCIDYLEVSIHQDLFSAGDTFKLVIMILDAKYDEDLNSYQGLAHYCKSEQIDVTDYAISIENRFDKNPYVSRVLGSEFSWFNKCGGENSGLNVMIHLRDEKGRIVNDMTETIYLKTELVYPDGTPAPYMPLMPLKERKTDKISQIPLYNPLRPEPILIPGQASISFSFRVEEVSFHHSKHCGFKLKVSHLGPSRYTLYSGLMEETIAVLSKPNILSQAKRRGRCRNVVEGAKLLTKSISTEESNISVPIPTFLRCFLNEMDQCRGCKRNISVHLFSFKSSHDNSCVFKTKLLPFMELFPHINSHDRNKKSLVKTTNCNNVSEEIDKKKTSNVTFHPETKSYNTCKIISTNLKPFPHETQERKDTTKEDSILDFDFQVGADIDGANNPYYEWMGKFM